MRTLLVLLLSTFYGSVQGQTIDWSIGIGGTGQDWGRDVTVDADGNVYAIGSWTLQTDMDPSSSNYFMFSQSNMDIYIAKYDPSGAFVWAKPIYGSESDYGFAIRLDDQNNIYITGAFKGTVDFDPSSAAGNFTSFGDYDFYLAKYDPNGQHIWSGAMGGSSIDWARDLVLDDQGNIYVTGEFYSVVDMDPGPNTAFLGSNGAADAFLAKYDNNGNYIWSIALGGTSFEGANAIAIDEDQDLYITGYHGNGADFDPGPGVAQLNCINKDIFLAKYDSSSQFVWALGMGGDTLFGSNCEAFDVAVTPSGTSFITGVFWGTADFDPSPATAFMTPIGSGDIFVARYNELGELEWAKQFGGTLEGFGQSIELDANENTYMSGYFSGTKDFDPGPGNNTLTSFFGRDLFAASLDQFGEHRWAFRGGGAGDEDRVFGSALLNDSSLFLTGLYMEASHFDPVGSSDSLYSHEDRDVFIAKYDLYGVTTGIAQTSTSDLSIHPNPASQQVVLSIGNGARMTGIQLMDVRGRTLYSEKLNSVTKTLSLEHFPPALYLLRVSTNKGRSSVHKLIVELY